MSDLYHYGVKGMKWGVRKKYRLKGRDKSVKQETKETEKRKLTRKQKAIIAGSAFVAAYATYRFVNSGNATRLIAKGKAALGYSDVDFSKNIKLADKNMDVDDIFSTVVKRINPDYGAVGTKNNCRRCTFAYEMSRRGYDVKATRAITPTGQSVIGLSSAVSDKGAGVFNYYKSVFSDKNSVPYKMFEEGGGKGLGLKAVSKLHDENGYSKSIFKSLSEYENGSRGELTVKWTCGGSHSMAWEVIKGKPVIFDCQTGKKYDSPDVFKELGDVISQAATTRLDNIDLNNDFLLRWLKNA